MLAGGTVGVGLVLADSGVDVAVGVAVNADFDVDFGAVVGVVGVARAGCSRAVLTSV